MFSKYLLPPDVFIRHWLIVEEIEKNRINKSSQVSLLDVGGSLGEIRKFLPDIKVITTDVVVGADVLYDGKKLPFKKGEYDYVVSIDTLEHIPSDRRLHLIGQMIKIAKRKMILIAPFASIEHEKYEKELVEEFDSAKLTIPSYLQEHRKYGLITTAQMNEVSKKYYSAVCKLVGRVWLDKLNFRVHLFEINPGKVNRLIYYLKFIWNLVINIISPLIIINDDKNTASRVTIVIDK